MALLTKKKFLDFDSMNKTYNWLFRAHFSTPENILWILIFNYPKQILFIFCLVSQLLDNDTPFKSPGSSLSIYIIFFVRSWGLQKWLFRTEDHQFKPLKTDVILEKWTSLFRRLVSRPKLRYFNLFWFYQEPFKSPGKEAFSYCRIFEYIFDMKIFVSIRILAGSFGHSLEKLTSKRQ